MNGYPASPLGPFVDPGELARLREQNRRVEWAITFLSTVFTVIVISVVGGILYLRYGSPTLRPFWLSPAPPEIPIAQGPRWVPGQQARAVDAFAPIVATASAEGVAAEAQSDAVVTAATQTSEPEYLKFNSRPSFPPIAVESLDPRDRAWYEWLAAGNLQYESWQYLAGTDSTQYYTVLPPLEAVICAVSAESLGGAPAHDLLAIKATESGNNAGPFASSSAGAKGPMQFLSDTFVANMAYPGANIQDMCDAMSAASNLLHRSEIFALRWDEDQFVYHFRGCPNADGGFDCRIWNNHGPQARAVYRLARQLSNSRAQFWGLVP